MLKLSCRPGESVQLGGHTVVEVQARVGGMVHLHIAVPLGGGIQFGDSVIRVDQDRRQLVLLVDSRVVPIWLLRDRKVPFDFTTGISGRARKMLDPIDEPSAA